MDFSNKLLLAECRSLGDVPMVLALLR